MPGPARVAFSAPSRSLSLTKWMGILRKERGEGKGLGKMEWGRDEGRGKQRGKVIVKEKGVGM